MRSPPQPQLAWDACVAAASPAARVDDRVWIVLLAMLPYWRTVSSGSFGFDFQTLAIGALPLCFAAMAQAVVVISGGIDLSVGSLIGSHERRLGAVDDRHEHRGGASPSSASSSPGLPGAHRPRDRRDPHPGHRRHARHALRLVRRRALGADHPGRRRAQDFYDVVQGTVGSDVDPVGHRHPRGRLAALWLSIRWLRPGLSFFAVGSSRNAAYLSGIDVARTRVGAYALAGVFCGSAGCLDNDVVPRGPNA